MGWWSALQISNTGAWCCRSRTPTLSRNTGALQQHGTDKIGEGAQAVVAALPAPPVLCVLLGAKGQGRGQSKEEHRHAAHLLPVRMVSLF